MKMITIRLPSSQGLLRQSTLSPAALVILAWVILDRAALLTPLTGADNATFIAFATLTLLAVTMKGRSDTPRQKHRFVRRTIAFVSALIAGCALAPSLSLFVISVALEMGWPNPQPLEPSLMTLVSTLLLAPIFEEILYRERLFVWLNTNSSTAVALGLSSLAFALPHPGPVSRLAAFMAGLILASTRLLGREWLPCLAFHVGLNLFGQLTATSLYPTWLSLHSGVMIGLPTLGLSIYLCRTGSGRTP